MMPQLTAKCPDCKQVVSQDKFKSHIQKCQKFQGLVYATIKKLSNKLTTSDLKFILAQLQVSKQYIQNKLSQSKNSGSKPIVSSTNNLKKTSSIQQTVCQIPEVNKNVIKCAQCSKPLNDNNLFFVEECWHSFCLQCVKKYIVNEFVNSLGNLTCLIKGCNKSIYQQQIKQVIGNDKFEDLQKKVIRKMMNIIECVKCHSQYQFAPGKPSDAPPKDMNGKLLTQADKQNYAKNRFVCQKPDCKAEQCKQCKSTPFHISMTCKQYKAQAQLSKCRFCKQPLNKGGSPLKTSNQALKDVCSAKQCQLLAATACTKMLSCGHACCGVKDEVKCLPCLNQTCSKNNSQLMNQNGQQYCNICFIQSLNSSPCVRSGCGHIFHEKCLKKRYEVRWITPRIFLHFCLCPLCKKWITVAPECKLNIYIKANQTLYNKIKEMSVERLKFEGCDKDEKLKDPKSPYFQKPQQYAVAIYAYFQCYKCKNPYFGGRKNCAQAMGEQQNSSSFKPQQLICQNCCEIPIQNCPKHGKDYIQFKCKYCCSTSQWFCWGNTHFCQPCHKRQCNGDYVSKYQKSKLPKCLGPGKCPIGGKHDGNGDQKALGCAACRSFKENSKTF